MSVPTDMLYQKLDVDDYIVYIPTNGKYLITGKIREFSKSKLTLRVDNYTRRCVDVVKINEQRASAAIESPEYFI